MKQYTPVALLLLVLFIGLNSISAQQTDSVQLRIDNIQSRSKFIDKGGKLHQYSPTHYPAFMKYPVSEKKPELRESGNKDADFNQYRNELQHWHFLYHKEEYVKRYGALPDLTGKKMPEGNSPVFDPATAPEQYRNNKPEQK